MNRIVKVFSLRKAAEVKLNRTRPTDDDARGLGCSTAHPFTVPDIGATAASLYTVRWRVREIVTIAVIQTPTH